MDLLVHKMTKTGSVSLIYQNEFIEWLKSLKFSYLTIEYLVKNVRILARKRLLNLSKPEFENEMWSRYKRAMRATYSNAYRHYWKFRSELSV